MSERDSSHSSSHDSSRSSAVRSGVPPSSGEVASSLDSEEPGPREGGREIGLLC